MSKSILRRLRSAMRAVENDIRSRTGSKIASALASEGYAGGYRDALYDVHAMLTHGYPADSRHYWDEKMQAEFSALAQPGRGGE